MSHQKKASLGVIFLTLFIDLIGFSILFPLFAAIMDHYGSQQSGILATMLGTIDSIAPNASEAQRAALFGGCLMGIYSVLQFVASPLWGGLSDRIGRRKVLLLTIAGNTLGYILWIFADAFWILLLSRAVCGLMAGNISVATAAVADVTDESNRAKGMGFVGMAFGFGFILGPVIGGVAYEFLPQWSGSEVPGFGLNPFSTAAMIAAGLSLLNLVWVVSRFGETLPEGDQAAERPMNPLRIFGSSVPGNLRAVVWTNLFYIILFAGMEATLVFLAWDYLNWSPGDMAWLFVVMGLVSAMVQGGMVRRLVPKMGERKLAIIGMALMIPGFAGIGVVALVPQGWVLYLAVVILSLGIGFTMPTLSALASLAVPSGQQGFGLGAYRSSGALARAIGPFLGAGLYFGLGALGPYGVGAVGMLIPLAIVARLTIGGPPVAQPTGSVAGESDVS